MDRCPECHELPFRCRCGGEDDGLEELGQRFEPVAGVRYRVSDGSREAVLFVNGPAFEWNGARAVNCQAEGPNEQLGLEPGAITGSRVIVIDIHTWERLE